MSTAPPETPLRSPLRIQAVAELTSVPAATLRAWERRYGIPSPARTPSAYRQYGREDVEQLVAMRKLVEGGMAPRDAARAVRASPPRAPSVDGGGRDHFDCAVDRILAAVVAYDGDAIEREVALMATAANAQTLFERVVGPASFQIGEGWHEGRLTVAQEHLATERFMGIVRTHLRLLQPAPPAPHALVASFADDEHVLGLLGAAIYFVSSGWRVTLLGSRTSPAAISDAARALAPDLIGLSVTVAPPEPRARELVDGYADAAREIPWVVGGRGAPGLERRVVKRGGFVAHGPGSQWLKEARGWLRSSPRRGRPPTKGTPRPHGTTR